MCGLAVQCHRTFEAITAKTIRIWNRNHMPLPELGCAPEKEWVPMLAAPQFDNPGYWHRRAERARASAQQMSSEQSKKMMLKIADACEFLAVKAAIRSETRGS